jgi:hypothetical protein
MAGYTVKCPKIAKWAKSANAVRSGLPRCATGPEIAEIFRFKMFRIYEIPLIPPVYLENGDR